VVLRSSPGALYSLEKPLIKYLVGLIVEETIEDGGSVCMQFLEADGLDLRPTDSIYGL
jgi:hypothetical protein